MYRCRPTVSEGSFDTLHRSNIVPSTAASTSSRSPGLSTRPQSRRPAHHLPEPLPGQIPIDGARPHGGPRVPSWEAFRRRPPEPARIATTGPASETLHLRRPSRRDRGTAQVGGFLPFQICAAFDTPGAAEQLARRLAPTLEAAGSTERNRRFASSGAPEV